MDEKWLPVAGFESFYEVSSLGRVRSLRQGKIMSPSSSTGYPMYVLQVKGEKFPRYAHRLVLEAFDGPCPAGQETRHLDRDASNPALCDTEGRRRLIWGTSSENKFDEVNHGTHYEASRTHCDNGHEWTEENTKTEYRPDGTFKARRCRECHRIESAARRAARKVDERHCKEEGCDKPYFGRDWCSMHYARWWRSQKDHPE